VPESDGWEVIPGVKLSSGAGGCCIGGGWVNEAGSFKGVGVEGQLFAGSETGGGGGGAGGVENSDVGGKSGTLCCGFISRCIG